MKTIIVIETPEELIEFANDTRQEGDKTPFLGNSAKLVFENDMNSVRLEDADGFELSLGINMENILKLLLKKANLDLYIT